MKNILKLAVSIGMSLSMGVIGAIFTSSSVNTWYANLNKPSFNPPNWLFGPAWTTLYVLMGVAFYLVWREGFQKKEVKVASALFVFQLILNAGWSFFFFGLRSPAYGLVEIVILWVAIIFTIFSFSLVSRASALLMLPYILWVTFATLLNYSILALNA